MKPTPAQTGPRLLVCDDSEVERKGLAGYLRRFNYVVEEVGEGGAAITAINARPFDLMILDLHMPGIDGFGVLEYLRQRPGKLPVILLSGLPWDQIQQRLYDVVGSDTPPLMLKPVNLDDLVEVLNRTFPRQPMGRGRG